MELPKGFWASLWSLVCFLPFIIGLWPLSTLKSTSKVNVNDLAPFFCVIWASFWYVLIRKYKLNTGKEVSW